MRDIWYGDKRDLVKWSSLAHISKEFEVKRILQIAFYRKVKFDPIEIDGQDREIPQEVLAHFRNIHNIRRMESNVPIEVFDLIFDGRQRGNYLQEIIKLIDRYPEDRLIVFLDPDTGLKPAGNGDDKRVLGDEAKAIWKALKPEDIFVLYQHSIREKGWISIKKNELAVAIGLPTEAIKYAHGPKIVKDVAFFYVQRK